MKKLTALIMSAVISAAALASCAVGGDGDITTSNDPQNNPSADPISITPDIGKPNENADVEADIYASIAEFSSEFAKLAASKEGKNTVVSPMSAYFALAMIKEGAWGQTLTEMTEVMGNISAEEMFALISHLTTFEHTNLNIANSVWIDNKFTPEKSYIDTIAKSYLAEGYCVTLRDAEKDINEWIEKKTEGLIKDILSDDALDNALMALVNTIYMDAKWYAPFKEPGTHEREFTSADGSVKNIEFMYANRKEYVIDNEDYMGVSIRYKDQSLRFIALMPKDKVVSTADLIGMVERDGGYAKLADTLNSRQTLLYLPKFELEYDAMLNDLLKEMGIKTAFSGSADFGGISPEMKIAEVLQNAVIKVDEEGTEAAAATVIVTEATYAPMHDEPLIMEFNRPFAFAVVDIETGAVLFCGQYNSAP